VKAIRLLAAGAALTATTVAAAQARTPETVLMSDDAHVRAGQEQLGYADAVIAGNTIYLSGIVAARRPGESSLEPAFERVFQRIGHILERAGSGYGDIVEMTSYHTDISGQIEAMSAVQRRHLGDPPPAWTAIEVARLLPDQGIAEIRIVARRSGPAPTQSLE
jgi:enamine deaminase RidA (YjgF/YER057c/UK114 family)